MSNILDSDFYQKVSEGLVAGYSLIHKFGTGELTTSIAPITNSGFYRTPTTAIALEAVSTSTQDGIGGTGARVITVIGLNGSGVEITQDVIMDGTTAARLSTDLFRLYRWFIKDSGTYATQSAGSQVGTITIQVESGGDVWSTSTITPFPFGQSQIGVYTVPTGFTAYLLSKNFFVDSNKSADIYFFKREDALNISAPFSPMRLVEREVGVKGGFVVKPVSPKLLGAGPMDVGFMGVISSGTAICSVEFELLLITD